MNLLLLYSLVLLVKPFSVSISDVSPNFSILFVQEFSPSRFSKGNLKSLLTFIDRLNQTLDLGNRSELWLMIGGEVYSSNSMNGTDNILKIKYSYLKSFWNKWQNIDSLGTQKNLKNITRYAGMFVEAGKHFNSSGATFRGQKVLILLTHGREQCKVEECVKHDCCRHCRSCNTPSCYRELMINNRPVRAKVFVSNEAEDLKHKGVTIIPMGVGNRTEPARLKCFASKNHYVQMDSYESLPVNGFKQVSGFLGVPSASLPASTKHAVSTSIDTAPTASLPAAIIDTTSSFANAATTSPFYPVASESGSAPHYNFSLELTTHRIASNTIMPPWWYTVAIAGGFIAVVLVLVVVIAILLKRRQRAKTATAGRHSSHVIHSEPTSGAPRVEDGPKGDTTGKTIGVLPGPQHGADGTFTKFGSGEKFRTLRLGLNGDVNVPEKYASAPELPDAGQSAKTSTHTIQGLYPKYSDGTLAALVTEKSATYDTVKSPNTKSGRSYATYQAGVTRDYEQFQ